MTPAPTALEPGDRAIDFARPDRDGRLFPLYEALCGAPALLAFIGSGRCPPALAALAEAAGRAAAAGGEQLAVVVVAVAGPEVAAPEIVAGTGWPVLCDDGAVTARYLGTADPAGAAPGAVLLDRAMRVRLVLPLDEAAAVPDEAHLRQAVAGPVGEPVATVAGLAPVLIVPEVLDPAACAELIAVHQSRGSVASGMPRLVDGRPALVVDPSVKIRRDHTITDPALTTRLAAAIERRLLPEIRKSFSFPATRFEAFKIVCYEAAADGSAGFFGRHRDNTTPDAAHRRFAMTLNLNTGDFAGGELCFPEYGPHRYLPRTGAAIVFACAHLHEVRPVMAGRRFALITFFYGDEEAKQRQARQRGG